MNFITLIYLSILLLVLKLYLQKRYRQNNKGWHAQVIINSKKKNLFLIQIYNSNQKFFDLIDDLKTNNYVRSIHNIKNNQIFSFQLCVVFIKNCQTINLTEFYHSVQYSTQLQETQISYCSKILIFFLSCLRFISKISLHNYCEIKQKPFFYYLFFTTGSNIDFQLFRINIQRNKIL
ncbi:transmembrane protein, putative (macronuclear) [Tetrahymena thermophila SB210]|uniref:Transmembrane protein, putative n=1 Tax=Tetrahymena thermophila (strain SB210) TaxID=312017 RepID=W7WX06_TETTS|nr:transmembrane protein, putative [Tetrahymena thermophila SB210]EWS71320.1 transmembrane protein, putative [Tetrahymena thermophila SB210]|eukprot:XP_012656138.1 transmembrane protein, putative [Tetrahymena thermophila SB210]